MSSSFARGLTLAALAALGLAAAHPAAAQTVVFAPPAGAPSNTGNGGGGNLALGNQFTDSATEAVTSLGFYDAGSVANTGDYNTLTRVDIFDQNTGTNIATVNVTNYLTGAATANGNQAAGGTQIGQYYFLSVDAGLTDLISSTTDTYVNSTFQSGNFAAGAGAIPNAPQTINDANVKYSTGTTGGVGVYSNNGSADPTNSASDPYLSGASFEVASPAAVSAAPEPSQLAGLCFAAVGLGGLVLKARKRTAPAA